MMLDDDWFASADALQKFADAAVATDKSFIDFDDALEFVEVFATGFAEPVKHKPGRALGDADLFRQLHRRDSFASGH